MATLSKLQVRTIQTINSGTLSVLADEKTAEKFDTIYIANSSTFYIANSENVDNPISKAVQNGEELKLSFKNEIACEGSGKLILQSDEAFEDMTLFFSVNASKIDHIIEFSITKIS